MIAWKAFIVSLVVAGIAAAKNATETQTARIFEEFQVPKEFLDFIKLEVARECKNADAEDKTQDAADAVIQFCGCAYHLFSDDTLSDTKLITAVREGKVAQYWKENCDKAVQFRKCFSTLMDGLSPCVPKTLIKSVAILKKDLDSVIDFICIDDGKRLTLLTTEEVMMCVMTKEQALRDCKDKLQGDDVRSMSSEKLCTKVDEVVTCAADALRTCVTSAPSDFLDAFVKHFLQKSGSCQINQRQE